MNYSKRLNMNAKVYSVQQELSDQNYWFEKTTFWKNVWFSIKITAIKSEKPQYLFIARWDNNFPKKFKLSFGGDFFRPINEVIIDEQSDLILFYAEKVKGV